ncbi:MAG: AIR synthase related protein, partial [Aquiluna sp.]
PVYDRPVEYPKYQDALNADSSSKLKRAENETEAAAQLMELISSPNHADKSWITNQYDKYVMGNTALAMPDDGGMIRISEETGLGVALATDANGKYCYLDPYEGARQALAEAYRNVAVTGAVPRAVTNCLNFGSPENPEVMWQFKQATAGLADACQELGIPVTGGNVSFYNQTGDTAIYPTPVVGVLGVIDDVARRVPSGWQDDGNNIYLLGTTYDELDGSAWAKDLHNHLGGRPPKVDLQKEKELASLLYGSTQQGLIEAAHDVSEGGLGIAILEASLRFNVGARIWLTELMERDGVDLTAALFSESQSRVIVSVGREDDVKFQALCEARGVAVLRIGVTDKENQAVDIQGVAKLELAAIWGAWAGVLPGLY